MLMILLTYKYCKKALCYNCNLTLLCIYILNFINRVKGMYAPLRICANISLEMWCTISSHGPLS